MRSLPDNYYDLGDCDVQYGIGEDSKANKSRGGFVKQKNGTKVYVPATDFGDEPWDNAPPSQEYFDELFRVCRYVILWGANYYQFSQKTSATGLIIWNKGRRKDAGQSDAEVAWTNLFNGVRIVDYLWDGFQQGRSIKQPMTPRGDKSKNEKRLQNGHKPIILREIIIKRFYKKDWAVYDSHQGSGSLRIACEKHGIDFTGTDISRTRWLRAKDWFDSYPFQQSPILPGRQQTIFNHK